jgi:hypothetical protein
MAPKIHHNHQNSNLGNTSSINPNEKYDEMKIKEIVGETILDG